MPPPDTHTAEIDALTRELARAQPTDVLQFCADYFNRRLAAQRAEHLQQLASSSSSPFRPQHLALDTPHQQSYHAPPRPISPFSAGPKMSVISEGAESTFPGSGGPFDGPADTNPRFGGHSPTTGGGGGLFRSGNPFGGGNANPFGASSPTATSPSGPRSGGPPPASSSGSPFGNFSFGGFGESMGGVSPTPGSPTSARPVVTPAPAVSPSNYTFNRRTSVSAESLIPSSASDEWTPPSFPKTEEQLERLRSAVAKNFLFTSLEEDQFTQVLNALNEKPIPAQGTRVITQGDVGDFFYVVERGSFAVYINPSGAMQAGAQGMGDKVTTYGPGGSFGELALMYNAPRAATVVSTEPGCILWSLDRVTFRKILLENTLKRRRMYESFLEEVPILASLTRAERSKIADALHTRVFADGEAIIREGDAGDEFYLVEFGEADVFKRGDARPLRRYAKGDYFGELALLSGEPRAASVVARGRCKVAALGRDGFERLLGGAREVMRRNDPRLSKDDGVPAAALLAAAAAAAASGQ